MWEVEGEVGAHQFPLVRLIYVHQACFGQGRPHDRQYFSCYLFCISCIWDKICLYILYFEEKNPVFILYFGNHSITGLHKGITETLFPCSTTLFFGPPKEKGPIRSLLSGCMSVCLSVTKINLVNFLNFGSYDFF